MDDKPFETPVLVRAPTGETAVASVRQALAFLVDPEWPVRGPRHRDATDACLKVLDGHRSTVDARSAFVEAVEEASMAA